ncbi:MAG: prepilin peptidase [bacterium]|nr:prepilin peptidase [bacterium]
MELLYLFLLLIGLVIGSFISMWSFRAPRNLTLSGRSFCDVCRKKIKWYRNIPLLSYIVLRGKCPDCKNKISERYPLIESFTALSFFLTGYLILEQGRVPEILANTGVFALPIALFLLTLFITLFVVDLEEQILPDTATLALGVASIFLAASLPSSLFIDRLFAGFIIFAGFLVVHLVTRGRGMGFGDVKLVFVLGILLGLFPSLTFLNMAFIGGAVTGLLLIALKKAKFGKEIAFGPFLLVSAWVSLFFSSELSSWYLSLFS